MSVFLKRCGKLMWHRFWGQRDLSRWLLPSWCHKPTCLCTVIHECKTPWAILWGEADTAWEEVPTTAPPSTGVKVQMPTRRQPAHLSGRWQGMVVTAELIRNIKIPGAFTTHRNGTKHSQTSIPRTNKTLKANRQANKNKLSTWKLMKITTQPKPTKLLSSDLKKINKQPGKQQIQPWKATFSSAIFPNTQLLQGVSFLLGARTLSTAQTHQRQGADQLAWISPEAKLILSLAQSLTSTKYFGQVIWLFCLYTKPLVK